MTRVSIIVPTKNMETSIASLLEKIYSQEFDGEFDVLIMDSSNDRTVSIAQGFPAKIVRVEVEDYNYGRTRNEGAAITDGDLLVFISADVEIIDRRWLSKLASHFTDPTVAGVYGRQLPDADAPPVEQSIISHTYPAESCSMSFDGNKIDTKCIVFFSNTNSAIRRSVWQQIKLPEMLKAEDNEWAKRVMMAGYKIIYDADAAVIHTNRWSLMGIFHEYFDIGSAMPVISREHVVDHSFKRFVLEGLGYVLYEQKFLVRNGYWHWIPYAFAYDTARFMGAFLGSKQRFLPIWMNRALCKKKNHWDRYDAVIREPS